ncbi:MAG: preQ(1) synthase [Bacteroidia bacterium]|nr:preQ(1) synthase [Bacteroidia bacterium]MDW8334566.1 preQ(1) synthase [Bacteroidia bacterium]
MKPEIVIADTRSSLDLEAKFQILKTFEIENRHEQTIVIETSEFSAVCPGTGLPDVAKLVIEYVPDRHCVELKSLKYYLFSFRNDAIFQEPVTDVIFDHLMRLLKPKRLKLTMRYNTRGGFDVTTVAESSTISRDGENRKK